MADRASKKLAYEIVRRYLDKRKQKPLGIWQANLYGSYVKDVHG